MKKSRKLAWCALPAIVCAGLVLVVLLSSALYTPWESGGSLIFKSVGPCFPDPTGALAPSLPAPSFFWKQRHQRFPWLPGADEVWVEVDEKEYRKLVERAMP